MVRDCRLPFFDHKVKGFESEAQGSCVHSTFLILLAAYLGTNSHQ